MSIFSMDSPLMRTMNKVANLMILNVLTLVCCVPVITGGAALTALHYMCLKIVRDEETKILAGYFKAFAGNFKQSTVIWLLLLLAAAVLGGDIAIMYYAVIDFPIVVRIAVFIMCILVLCTALYVFPMQAKFENPVRITIKNAFRFSLAQFPRTVVMVALFFVAPLMLMISERFAAVVFFFGMSFHAYVSALLYNAPFKKMEERAA